MSRRGWLLFSAMGFLWGIPYLLIKVAVEDLSPPVVVWGRTVIGALVLVPLALRRGDLKKVLPMWRVMLAFTAIEIAVPWLLLNDAERHLSSSFAGLLIATTPLVATAVAVRAGTERFDARRAAGLAVGLLGVGTLLGLDLGGEVRAGVELGAVVVLYGVGATMIDRHFSDVPTLGVMSFAFSAATIAYMFVVPSQWPDHAPATKVVLSVLALGLLCTVAAFLVFFALIAEVGASRATVITFVNPAVAVTLGILLLDEPFTAGVALGFPLVLLGCWLATRHARHAVVAVAEP
ncbi:MAG TPA: DMT family transporter [Mycobacteriales bacterium]|nr:DMT family transporter [Mycobacteriales bacterium]